MFGIVLCQYIINGIAYAGLFITGGYHYGYLCDGLADAGFRTLQVCPPFNKVDQYQKVQACKQ